MATYSESKLHIYDLIGDQLDQLKATKVLKLINFNNGSVSKQLLSEVFECIHEFVCSFDPPLTIEKISLANNQITDIPDNISIIANDVRYLDFHRNSLTGLPLTLLDFENLEILDLTSNKLWDFPASIIGNLTNLKVLSLKENKLKYLPLILGELPFLNFIDVADNPLVLPSQDLVKSFQKSYSDDSWVVELKQYLVANKSVLDQKISELKELKLLKRQEQTQPPQQDETHSTEPMVTRSMSTSDTRSSRALRRMGLIIKKDRSNNTSEASDELESSNNSMMNSSEIAPTTADGSSSLDYSQFIPDIDTPPPVSMSISNLQASSPIQQPLIQPPIILQPKTTTASTNIRPTRPNSRSRSNTLKEIDNILQKNEVDTENKSGAYFRRLSTLQELPSDEPSSTGPNSSSSSTVPSTSRSESRNGGLNPSLHHPEADVQKSAQSQIKADEPLSSKLTPNLNRILPLDSPTKSHFRKSNSTAIIKVSRKILFSFSELHSSVRRFSGFCTDKKVSYKMVSYLYTTKANVDTLVENLEMMEESDNNLHQIVGCLHTCITSFKAMMALLSENLSVFVANIDVCFIRMLFLTIYGSMNELLNAYRILNLSSKPPQLNIPMVSQNDNKPKLSVNTGEIHETEEVDENLYRAIDIATSNAQVVFSELTKAIANSAIASASNNSSTVISQSVAKQVKELTGICMTSMDITKRLKTKLITIRNNPSTQTKRGFWDDVNLFLKTIIQTFQSVKGIMQDLPILNEIRGSMSNLTKNTKDLTLLLEASSYKSMASESSSSSTNANTGHGPVTVPSLSNIFTPIAAHPGMQMHSQSQVNLSQMNNIQPPPVRTPLVATLGPAAQAILPMTNSESGQSMPTFTSPLASPGLGNGPATAPVTTLGQFFAKTGMNPFDGLIMAEDEKTTN